VRKIYLKSIGEDEINKLFGIAPKSIYENLDNLNKYSEKLKVLQVNNIFSDEIINSYKATVLNKWKEELINRRINDYTVEIEEYKPIHVVETVLDNDLEAWEKINEIRKYLAKDLPGTESLFTRIRVAAKNEKYEVVSELSIELEKKMDELRKLYVEYKRNMIEI